jgi:hypothetical protein
LGTIRVVFPVLQPGDQVRMIIDETPHLLRHRLKSEVEAARAVPLNDLPVPQDRIPGTKLFREASDANRALGAHLLVSLVCP